jgi:hypothetical protein
MFVNSRLCDCFCALLIVGCMPDNLLAGELSEPSAEKVLREVLDEPIDRENLLEGAEFIMTDKDGNDITNESNSNGLDPLTERILELYPDLTGELMAIQTMMSEQLKTPDGEDKFNFYIHYLTDSNEPLDPSRNASELYRISSYCQDVHHHFEQIIINYGHMSNDKTPYKNNY